MRADIHGGQEQNRSIQGPDTEAQDPIPPSHFSACNARPVHTVCQNRKSPGTLFDHLIGAGEQRGRHIESECTSRLEIDDQLELRWCLNW